MKLALRDGQVLIIEADQAQFQIIKSWGKMKWNKTEKMFSGPADAETLNKLAGLVRLPAFIESERVRLNRIVEAVDRERMNPDPRPLYNYPVKQELYKHQIRGANMALMTFGLIPPPDRDDPEKNIKG